MMGRRTRNPPIATIAELPVKHARFIEFVLAGRTICDSAKAAGYPDPNYGKQLMLRKNVREAIEEGRRRMAVRAEVDANAVVQEICCLAFADPKDMQDANGKPIPLRNLPEKLRRALTVKIVSTKGKPPIIQISLDAKTKNDALEKLMNYLGVYPDGKNDPKKLPAGDGGGSDRALTHEEKQEAVKRFLGWDRGRAVDGQGSGDGAESPPDVPGGPSEVDGTTDEPGPLAGGPAPLPL